MQRGALFLQLHLDDLLRVVPRASGVGHEDGLVKAEDGDGNQITDEEERLETREGEGGEEDGDEDVEHALLRVLRADGHYLLRVFDRRLFRAGVEADVALDEF